MLYDVKRDRFNNIQLDPKVIRSVSFGLKKFSNKDMLWVSCDCTVENGTVFRALVDADFRTVTAGNEDDILGECFHSKIAVKLLTFNYPNGASNRNFRLRFRSSSSSDLDAVPTFPSDEFPRKPVGTNLVCLKARKQRQTYLHYYPPEKRWIASYIDDYNRFKHVNCERTGRR